MSFVTRLAHFRRHAMHALTAALLLALPSLAAADVTLSGSVVDAISKAPVSGAVVAASPAARATTDESGHFTLKSDADFKSVTVTRIGYEKKTVAVADKSQPITIELAAAAVELEGLELTGRALARTRLDEAKSTGTLTKQDLNRGSGLSLENSINTVPGIVMQSRTPWGGAHIQIRGYYPNFSQNSNGLGYQLFLNDIPVTDASGQTISDDIDYSTLGRLDVVKGPSSSLYGAAIAGAVSMQTFDPKPGTRVLEQHVVGGSDKLFRSNTLFMMADEYSSMVLDYGHQTYDSFRPNSGSQKDFARFTGKFHAGPKQTISTYFSYNNSYEQIAGELDSTDFYNRKEIDNPVYATNRSRIDLESNRLGITHEYAIDSHLDLKNTFFGTAQTFRQPFAHGFNDANRFNFGGRSTFGLNTKAGVADLSGHIGGQFQRTNYTTNGYFLPASRPSDQENYAMNYYGFTEWSAALPQKITVTVGATLSKNEFGIRNMLKNNIINDTTFVLRRAFDADFTPTGSIVKVFNDAFSIYGSMGKGYTAPSITSFINSDNTINTGLKPEHALQKEVGSKGSVLNHKLSYELALFTMDISDKLVSQKVGAVTSTVNVGKQRNRGLELTLSGLVVDDPSKTLSLVRPWLTYTYSDFKYMDFKSDNNNNASTVNFSGKKVARVPQSVFNIGLDAATRSGFSLFASFQHVDKAYFTFNNSNFVKPYNLVNAKLGYTTTLAKHFALDLSAGGDNLTSETYYTFLFVGPNFKGLAQAQDGGTGDGYIIPGPYDATYFGSAKISYSF